MALQYGLLAPNIHSSTHLEREGYSVGCNQSATSPLDDTTPWAIEHYLQFTRPFRNTCCFKTCCLQAYSLSGCLPVTVDAVNHYACMGLDNMEKNFPVLNQSAEEVGVLNVLSSG